MFDGNVAGRFVIMTSEPPCRCAQGAHRTSDTGAARSVSRAVRRPSALPMPLLQLVRARVFKRTQIGRDTPEAVPQARQELVNWFAHLWRRKSRRCNSSLRKRSGSGSDILSRRQESPTASLKRRGRSTQGDQIAQVEALPLGRRGRSISRPHCSTESPIEPWACAWCRQLIVPTQPVTGSRSR